MLVQIMLGRDSYIELLEQWFIVILLHAIVLINALFLLNGERYYNEDVGGE